LLLLPLITFGLVILFGIKTELAVGMMILAACPGGATSNLISHLAKGDTALSITLTAFSSVFTVVSIPVIVNFALVYFMPNGAAMRLDVSHTIISVFLVVILPVLGGMFVRYYKPNFAVSMESVVKYVSALFLLLIITGAAINERERVWEYFQLVGPVSLALNIITLTLGFYLARLFNLSPKQSTTISIETGIQNGTLGIGVAATLIGNSIMTIPSAIYSLIMFVTAFVVIYLGHKTIK
jgi:BASS family bile acid:Na+ symporter